MTVAHRFTDVLFTSLDRTVAAMPFGRYGQRRTLVGGLGVLVGLGAAVLTGQPAAASAGVAVALGAARAVDHMDRRWIPTAPENLASPVFRQIAERHAQGRPSDAAVRTTRFAKESVPERARIEHAQNLATLSPKERAKLERAEAMANRQVEQFLQALGLPASTPYSVHIVREAWNPNPGMIQLIKGDRMAGYHTSFKGESYVTVNLSRGMSLPEADLRQVIVHELVHALLSHNLFRYSLSLDVLTSKSGFKARIHGPEALDDEDELTGFAARAHYFDEAVTEFLAWVIGGELSPLSHVFAPAHNAERLRQYYIELSHSKRAAFLQALVAAKLEGSFKPLFRSFVEVGAPASTVEDRARLMSRLLALDFDGLAAPRPLA